MIDDEARNIKPGAEGLVVLPHLQGSGPPDSNQSAKAVIYGLTLSHTQQHIARACLESVAITLCRMVESVETLGVSIKEIRSLGGGAKSPLWCQIKADATGKLIKTMKNTENAACLGAGVLAGVAVGIWPSVVEAMETIASEEKIFMPDISNQETYHTLLRRYKALTIALQPVFEG
jgi:xylulokinase